MSNTPALTPAHAALVLKVTKTFQGMLAPVDNPEDFVLAALAPFVAALAEATGELDAANKHVEILRTDLARVTAERDLYREALDKLTDEWQEIP